jgi:hypothetical protein
MIVFLLIEGARRMEGRIELPMLDAATFFS